MLGWDNVARTRRITPPFLVSKLLPFDLFFSRDSFTPHNSVTVRDTFVQLYRNMY